jgi:hypothetical protein
MRCDKFDNGVADLHVLDEKGVTISIIVTSQRRIVAK